MKQFYILAVLFLAGDSLYAQDMIYLTKGKQEPGIVVDITSDKVRYKSNNGASAVKSLKTDNIVLLFNTYGDYLKFTDGGSRDFSGKDAEDFIKNKQVMNNDLIFDNKGKIRAVKLISAKDDTTTAVYQGKEIKIATNTIYVIIKQDGSHHLYTNTETAVKSLPEKDSIKKYLLLPPEQLLAKKSEPVIISKDGPKIKNPIDQALIYKQANREVTDFTNYIKGITNASSTSEHIKEYIDLACGLFVNEDARVEISSLNSPKKKLKIRTYLNHLANSPYTKIEIDYAIAGYSPTLTKGSDGNYHGTVTMVQKFKGYKDGLLVYGDQTERNINFVVKQQKTTVETGYAFDWTVLLTDMGVVETDRLN